MPTRPILNDKTADILTSILEVDRRTRELGRSDQQRLLLALEELRIAAVVRGDSERIAHDKRLTTVAETITLRTLDALDGFRVALHGSSHDLDFRSEAEMAEALHSSGPVEPPKRKVAG